MCLFDKPAIEQKLIFGGNCKTCIILISVNIISLNTIKSLFLANIKPCTEDW